MASKKFDKKAVEHVAKLANLDLSEKEKKLYGAQLAKVVEYVSELESVDTSKVDPTYEVTGLSDVIREDKLDPMQTLEVEDAVSEAADTYNNYFKVPAILDKDK